MTWDLMQSKAIARKVPDSFIKLALEKHSATVSQVHRTDPTLLQEFTQFCEPVMTAALESLTNAPYPLPNTHASLETSCRKGGLAASWKNNSLGSVIQPSEPRIDPTTYVVCGPPGCGKSLLQSLISRLLARKLKRPLSETVYCRNAEVKHWDGYQSQPLVMIDDFLQRRSGQADNTLSLSEFITLNSTTDYVLPMADLKDKGLKFSSPLLLYSSNLTPTQMDLEFLRNLTCHEAALRRISGSIEWEQGVWVVRSTPQLPSKQSQTNLTPGTILYQTRSVQLLAKWVVTQLYTEWCRKSTWYQTYFSDAHIVPLKGTNGASLKVPQYKPTNRVKVCAVCEPLKVRTITVGTARNFLLKPIQEAMFKALKKYPEFKPCFTPEYEEELFELHQNGLLALSGDYSSATDGLHSDLFRAAFDGFKEFVPEYMKDDLEREIGIHECVYPDIYEIPKTFQTNGQLMGSLMSFPILCLANAFTLHKATGLPLGKLPALLHGDDVAAFLTSEQISKWKEFCPRIGLELSLGKNYVSDDFVSIDSQLYHLPTQTRLSTGKYKCYVSQSEQAVTQLLAKGLPKSLVVDIGKRTGSLLKTCRSIDVSTEYGGLGLEGKPEDPMSKVVWIGKVRNLISSKKIAGSYQYYLPISTIQEFDLELTQSEGCTDQDNCRRFHRLLKHFKNRGGVPDVVLSELPKVGCVYRTEQDPLLENLVKQCQAFLLKGFTMHHTSF